MSPKTLKIVIPIVVLIIGAVAAVLIASARKAPPRVDHPPLGPLVEVTKVEVTDVPVTVAGHGEVVPRVAVDLIPQVAGQVSRTHGSLVAGGIF